MDCGGQLLWVPDKDSVVGPELQRYQSGGLDAATSEASRTEESICVLDDDDARRGDISLSPLSSLVDNDGLELASV